MNLISFFYDDACKKRCLQTNGQSYNYFVMIINASRNKMPNWRRQCNIFVARISPHIYPFFEGTTPPKSNWINDLESAETYFHDIGEASPNFE